MVIKVLVVDDSSFFRSKNRSYFKKGQLKLIVIGASTGGPLALQKILTKLDCSLSVPVIVVQHMPAAFTQAFAQRLDQMCKITVKEARDGEFLQPATAYLAPGGKQLLVRTRGGKAVFCVENARDSQTYKPSVDMTFSSVANIFSGNVLGVILTGMGIDGREGAREIKKRGGVIWVQDEKSCVVYGMPAAVTGAGLTDRTLTLDDVGWNLAQQC